MSALLASLITLIVCGVLFWIYKAWESPILIVWIDEDETIPNWDEDDDIVKNSEFIDEYGMKCCKVKIHDSSTYHKKAHLEFLRRLEIMKAKEMSRSLDKLLRELKENAGESVDDLEPWLLALSKEEYKLLNDYLYARWQRHKPK